MNSVTTILPIRFSFLVVAGNFAPLADPTRHAILRRLAEGDATVLAQPFPISVQAVSKHLKVAP
jgi:DNA-binding transcriptional ArsR family regulator